MDQRAKYKLQLWNLEENTEGIFMAPDFAKISWIWHQLQTKENTDKLNYIKI